MFSSSSSSGINYYESEKEPLVVPDDETSPSSAEETDENELEAITEKPQGWLVWAGKGIYDSVVSAKNRVVYAITHPVQSLINLGVSALALATSGQPIINAALNPSGASAKDISLDLFNKMSTFTKIRTIANALASFLVNFPLNKSFIKELPVKLKTSVKEMFTGVLPFFKNNLAFYLAIMAGFTSGLLTWEAFSFIKTGIATLDLIIPLSIAGLSAFITAAARYIGTKRAFSIIKSLFSHDAKVQIKAVDALRHFKANERINVHVLDDANSLKAKILEAYQDQQNPTDIENKDTPAQTEERSLNLATIQQLLINRKVKTILRKKQAEGLKNLSEADYEILFTKLAKYTAQLETLLSNEVEDHTSTERFSLFYEKKFLEYVTDFTRRYGYTGLALLLATPAWVLFTQKAIDGFRKISDGKFEQAIPEVAYQATIGTLAGSGTASFLLYFSATRECLQLIEDISLHFYRHPKDLKSYLYLITTLGVNVLAAESMRQIAMSAFEKEDFVFSYLMPYAASKETMAYLVQLVALCVNGLPSLRTFRQQPLDPNHPTTAELIEHFSNTSTHTISKETAENMTSKFVNHRVSFFNRKPQSASRPTTSENVVHASSDSLAPSSPPWQIDKPITEVEAERQSDLTIGSC